MPNRTLFFLILALICIATAFLIHLVPFGGLDSAGVRLTQGDVESIEVQRDRRIFVLNFDQQQQMVDWINRMIPVGEVVLKEADANQLTIEGIKIYRFADDVVELNAVGVKGNDLVFRSSVWNPEGGLKETTDGEMIQLLNNATYP